MVTWGWKMVGHYPGVAAEYQISDPLWEQIRQYIPARRRGKKAGRPPMADRQAMTAIFSVMCTSCQWKALPRCLGAPSTVHDRFQEWCEAGVFEQLWQAGLLEYDKEVGIDWEWQAMDGAMTKAPLGGKRNRPQSYRSRQIRRQA